MSITATRAPSFANARTISRPMPDAPAVMSTFFMLRILPGASGPDSTVGSLVFFPSRAGRKSPGG
jgi:hypothetical protein